MEFLRGWREDWPGKNDETWTFWRHIGPLGRTVWGLDRIPLKDLKVGEEVDGRVKGRYRSMGWFLVRKVSLEGGGGIRGIHSFPRGHTDCWAVLQCLHEMIDWGILVPKSVEVEKLGRKGYFRFIYIYTSFKAFTVSSFNLIPFLTSPSYLNRQVASQNFRNKKQSNTPARVKSNIKRHYPKKQTRSQPKHLPP